MKHERPVSAVKYYEKEYGIYRLTLFAVPSLERWLSLSRSLAILIKDKSRPRVLDFGGLYSSLADNLRFFVVCTVTADMVSIILLNFALVPILRRCRSSPVLQMP